MLDLQDVPGTQSLDVFVAQLNVNAGALPDQGIEMFDSKDDADRNFALGTNLRTSMIRDAEVVEVLRPIFYHKASAAVTYERKLRLERNPYIILDISSLMIRSYMDAEDALKKLDEIHSGSPYYENARLLLLTRAAMYYDREYRDDIQHNYTLAYSTIAALSKSNRDMFTIAFESATALIEQLGIVHLSVAPYKELISLAQIRNLKVASQPKK